MTASIHLLLIQTILSVLEFHQISTFALADFTADREFHPALKTFLIFSCLYHYIRQTLFLSTKVLSMQNLHFRAFAKWQAVHVASTCDFCVQPVPASPAKTLVGEPPQTPDFGPSWPEVNATLRVSAARPSDACSGRGPEG